MSAVAQRLGDCIDCTLCVQVCPTGIDRRHGLLSVASVALAASVALRSPFQVDVVKDRGALARIVEDGAIENVYRLQIMNRTGQPQAHRIDARGIPGLQAQAEVVSAPPAGIRSVVVRLRLAPSAAQGLLGTSAPVQFEVSLLDRTRSTPAVQREKSTFFVPR